ncbi:MAG: ABC transporter substrate-binding protein, partial [Pseudomonadota bacterium]
MCISSITRRALIATATTVLLASTSLVPSYAEMLDVEKDELKFGFIKLTDMAPLAIAYEKGYFEEEGLFVTLEPQA